MIDFHRLAWTEECRFRGALDDVIIIPLVLVTLAANKILRFILAVLMRLLDYAFPLAMQVVWLPLFAAKILGNVVVTVASGALRLLPLSETKRRQWRISIRRNWSWLRHKTSYRAFEQAVHIAFEGGMAWVFRQCRHLTPNAALLVIVGAVLWLPLSFGVATAMHAVLFARVTSWPAWMQLLHPLATIIAKSKLLVLPVYPAAWPQAKKHPFIQFIFNSYDTIRSLYVIKKVGFRYRQAEAGSIAAVERLERTTGLASAMRWLRGAHVAAHLGVEKPTEKLRSFFSRWSIKFSAEYYEAKERQASLNHSELRMPRLTEPDAVEPGLSALSRPLQSATARRHNIHPGQPADFSIRNLSQIAETAEGSNRTMSILLAAMAPISLLVGGIGIMNILLVSVTERTREIGLRMAIGARRIHVLLQFLAEAVFLSVSGGIAGILTGVAFSIGLPVLTGWPAPLSISAIAGGFLLSAAVGIFFGYYPARKAAHLNPIEALRYE